MVLGTTVPVEITVAVIGAAASVFVAASSALVSNVKERRSRKRDIYGQAFRAVASYKEYPYIIRRRKAGSIPSLPKNGLGYPKDSERYRKISVTLPGGWVLSRLELRTRIGSWCGELGRLLDRR